MAEYILREAAIKRFNFAVLDCLGMEPTIRAGDIIKALESIPAADVRPVVRGRIEEDENTYLWCSECGCNITLAAYEMPNGNLILRPNFCPNCGADMREP